MIKYSLLLLLCSCSTQYIPSNEIRPTYPNIKSCPDLELPTQTTWGQSIINNYGLYYQCQAEVEMIRKWIELQYK